jgi:hypothetical protein
LGRIPRRVAEVCCEQTATKIVLTVRGGLHTLWGDGTQGNR